MRKINDMFHTDDDGYLVKTSNGQRVTEDEPLFILRGRDALAISTLTHYHSLMLGFSLDAERAAQVEKVVDRFRDFSYAYPERMKQPGSTRGR